MRPLLAIVLVLAIAGGLSRRVPTMAAGSSALVTVSGPSPFAGCAAPNLATRYTNAELEPHLAVNPATVGTGHLNQYDEVLIASSGDGGRHWTAPARVSATQSFNPAVTVAGNGTVGVTYDDLRDLTTGTIPNQVDRWFTSSQDGGATFGNETQLGAFDIAIAPNVQESWPVSCLSSSGIGRRAAASRRRQRRTPRSNQGTPSERTLRHAPGTLWERVS